MLAFIYNNSMVIVVVAVLIVLILMYFYFKSLPAKVKKKEEKKEAKQEPVVKEEAVETKQETEPTVKEEVKVEEKGKSPKVSQIYKRTKQEPVQGEESKVTYDTDYDAEFVNVSKNVSRFKGLVAKEDELKQLVDEAENNEFGFVTDSKEECDFCEAKTSHFDHSRRLSKYIKEDNFDGMFASHISDYYMNMDNIDKHIGVSDEGLEKLYEKAAKTISNSDKRLSSGIVEKSIIRSEIEEMNNTITDEDLKSIADLRTVVITDSIMNRKKKK